MTEEIKKIENSMYKPLLKKWWDNKEALRFIETLIAWDKSIFLTWKAWTWKSTLIKDIIDINHNKWFDPIILGSTGIAAMNIWWKTVHSFFKLSIDNIYYKEILNNLDKFIRDDDDLLSKIKEAPFIIIDEVSMLSSNIIDCVNVLINWNMWRMRWKAFGWKQIIFTWDVLQLAPVANEEWEEDFDWKYKSPWFFDSHTFLNTSWYDFDYSIIELKKNYRQHEKDKLFWILDRIRDWKTTNQDIDDLNSRIEKPNNQNIIRISTHNDKVDEYNEDQINKINSRAYYFNAEKWWKQPEVRAKQRLKLKDWSRIMMLNNDKDQRRVNWTMGIIEKINKFTDTIRIHMDDGNTYDVKKNKWDNERYFYNERWELDKRSIWFITQFPVQLAWAITVHKSQWLTFDNCYLDIASTFTWWQWYTALSRVRTLNWLYLSEKISKSILYFDKNALNYYDLFVREEIFDKVKLTEKEAIELSKYSWFSLCFVNLTTLTEDQAKTLISFKWKRLKFPALKQITPEVFNILIQFKWSLDLSWLEEASEDQFKDFKSYKCNELNITWLSSIPERLKELIKDYKIISDEEKNYSKAELEDKRVVIINKKVLWDENKKHIFTWTHQDPDWYDIDWWNDNWKHKLTNSKYGPDGFDWNDWNKYDFHRTWRHRSWWLYDSRWFDIYWININTRTKYDKNWYDRNFFTKYWFDTNWIHKKTKRRRDKHYFDINWINMWTWTIYDYYWNTQEWYYRNRH